MVKKGHSKRTSTGHSKRTYLFPLLEQEKRTYQKVQLQTGIKTLTQEDDR